VDHVTPFAWLSRGDDAQLRGDLPAAREAYESSLEAARSVQSRRAQAWSHIRLATVRGRVEGLQALQEHLVEAEPLLDPGDAYLRGLFHCTRAGADPERRLDTMEDLELGKTLAQESGIKRLFAACAQVQASVYLNRGETGRALEIFHEAQGIQAEVGDRAGRAGSLQRAGHVYVTLGAHGWAQSYLEQAIVEGEASGSLSAVSWALMNLSTISWTLGDLASARTYAQRAEVMMRDQGDAMGMDVVVGQKGDLSFAAGDYPSARLFWTDALDRYRKRGNSRGVFGIHTALLRLDLAEGKAEEAEEELVRARNMAGEFRMGSWAHSLLYDEGEIALRKGDLDRAEGAFLAYLQGGQTPFRTYKARARLAEIAARRGNVDEAERQLRIAIEAIEGWRATLDATGLRRYAFQVAEYAADPDLGAATVLAALARDGRGAVGFDLAERQRARGLFEAMVRADAAREHPLSKPLPPDAPPLEAPTPLTSGDILADLPDSGIAVLEYVTGVGGEPTTVFVLSEGGVSTAEMEPVDSLRRDIERLGAMVRAGMDPESAERDLGSRLLQPALELLSDSIQRLVIIPDGALHRVPWDVLRLADGQQAVERYGISQSPSATVLAQIWRTGPPTPASTLLAFANPAGLSGEQGAGADPVRRGPLDEIRRELPPLPGSALEARLVARFAEASQVRTGAGATESFLEGTALEEFRVLHFATHALVDEATLSRTALVLAPDGEEDGFVFPGDLARLDLQADLVVLSACRTAGGSVIRGEGIQGMTAPLLEAGARSILATGWEIDDRWGRRFVKDLYRSLARGRTVGESLRGAKLAAIGRGEAPGQWAAFTLVGDPDVTVTLREPGRSWLLVVGPLLAGALLLALLLRSRGIRKAE